MRALTHSARGTESQTAPARATLSAARAASLLRCQARCAVAALPCHPARLALSGSIQHVKKTPALCSRRSLLDRSLRFAAACCKQLCCLKQLRCSTQLRCLTQLRCSSLGSRLLEVRDEVGTFLGLLQAGEHHLGAWGG